MLTVECRLTSSIVQSRARPVRAEMEGAREHWMQKMSEARTEDVLSWTDMNDFPRAEGEGSGKWIWTGRLKPSSGGSHGSGRAAQN